MSENDVLLGLKASTKACKSQALNWLSELTSNADEEHISKLFEDHGESLVNLFSDPSESIQQKAIATYSLFANLSSMNTNIDSTLPNLLNILTAHLVDKETFCESEEIRLLELQLLKRVCEIKGAAMKFYADASLKICEHCLSDAFSDVRVVACQCLETLIPNIKEEFHSKSDPIIDALLVTFTHSQAKVRCATTELFGSVLHYGNNKRVSDVWRSFAQRVIDSHHAFRRSIFRVLHFLMTQFRDRYSHWNRFVPLVLCGLFDEIDNVRKESQALWKEIGEQYANENREEMKEEELRDDLVNDYPTNTERPSIGCRLLVKKVFFNVLHANLNDLKDWQETVRIQAVNLLYQLILHAEGHITILTDKIIGALPHVAKDENRAVVKGAINCAQLLGHFVDPKLWCTLLLPQMDHANHVVVLNGLLKGTSAARLKEWIPEILKVLQFVSISRQKALQFYVNECCFCLLEHLVIDDEVSAFGIFQILVQIRGLLEDDSLIQAIDQNLARLADKFGVPSVKILYEKCSAHFITAIVPQAGSSILSSASLEYQILHAFLTDAGVEILCTHFHLLRPALRNHLALSQNVGIKSKIYNLLIDVVQKHMDVAQKLINQFRLPNDEELIEELFTPNMEWKSGRTEAVLRMTCVCCLAVLMDRGVLLCSESTRAKTSLLPKLLSLARDEKSATHRAVIRLLRIFVQKESIFEGDFKDICPVLLKGLDDEKFVRHEAFRALEEFYHLFSLRAEWLESNRAMIEESSRICLVHLDDSDREIRIAALECLKSAGSIASSYLCEQIQRQKYLYQNTERLSLIDEHFKNL